MILELIKPLWSYRDFVHGSVRREFQAKYQNSLLGALWTVLNPLAMIVVYTVIFSQVMRSRLPGVDSTFAYSIFLCAGLLTWGMFAEITGRAQNIFIENANLLKKLTFPRLCLPVIVVATAALNFLIIFGIFTIFLVVTGNFPGMVFVALIPLLLLLGVFAIGLGVVLGVLNVFFRDVGQFYGILLQFWFWLTPIVYPPSILPEGLRGLVRLNPMARLVGEFQAVLVNGNWPNWIELWPVLVFAILFCIAGLWLFRRHAGEMVDEL